MSPKPRPRPAEPTGLADRLEPAASGGALPARKRRTGLWLGLGGLVAAAGAAVAFLMINRGEAETPSRSVDAAGGAIAKAPAAFLPPDVPIVSSQQEGTVTVHVAADWKPAEVLHVWKLIRGRYERLVAEQAVTARVPEPLSIVVVPARILCDARTFENGAVPEGCGELGHYYRPGEQTLLVSDDRARLELELGVGLAELVCIHQGDRVCDLVDPFEEQLRR